MPFFLSNQEPFYIFFVFEERLFKQLTKYKVMTPQVKAILTHITFIGWIIILIVNSNERDELSSFYLRQTLGIYLIGLIGTIIPVFGVVVWVISFILWVISLVGAIQQDQKPLPFVGDYFQAWFRGIA